jgi:hypothetical protein
MDLPILDILRQTKEANQLPTNMSLCDNQQWQEGVEMYAPGYLALEAEGHGGEYDLNPLTAPDMVEGTRKRIWQRLQSGQNPQFRICLIGYSREH